MVKAQLKQLYSVASFSLQLEFWPLFFLHQIVLAVDDTAELGLASTETLMQASATRWHHIIM